MVDALDLAAGDLEGGMGNDPFEVLIQQLAEPEKMRVAGGLTDVHDVDDLLRHACFVRISVSLVQFLLDEVEGK